VDVYVGRQPIFDVNQNVFAYELLFRRGDGNEYSAQDGDGASKDVIANSFLNIGMDTLTGGKRAFINFTENLLKQEVAETLPQHMVAVEVLENVTPDEGIILACRKLKSKGYMLVLDDFVFATGWLPIIELADVIKVDFMNTSPPVRRSLVERFAPRGIKFLAEKIETYDDFRQAAEMGYSYFQGFFFSRPVVVAGKNLAGNQLSYLQIMREVYQPEFSIADLAAVIGRDASLSYKLLKFVNSAAVGLKHKIKSIQHALSLLGQQEVRKWGTLIVLRELALNKPDELMTVAVVRAKFAEGIALACGWRNWAQAAFLTGMLSLLDVLVEQPMTNILAELTVDDEIQQALLGRNNKLHDILLVVVAFEQNDWEAVCKGGTDLGLSATALNSLYWQAIRWGKDVVAGD